MAIASQPLLSISARGSIGNALTFYEWHGLQVVRKYSAPACKPSASQKAARDQRDIALQFWRSTQQRAHLKDAWQRALGLTQKKSNWANFAIGQAFRAADADPDGSQVTTVITNPASVVFQLVRVSDQQPIIGTWPALLVAGPSPRKLELIAQADTAPGGVAFLISVGPPSRTYFVVAIDYGTGYIAASGILRRD